jgi:hypothetical protein
VTVSSDNKAIKIPDNHYVGFSKRGEEEIPLGFMTPDGTDAAAIKRKGTVDSWANPGHSGRKGIPSKSFANKPMTGFKMGRSVRHGGGWGQGNVKWRIEDPRGFELEISSPNFAQIIAVSTLENGEILEKCVWGRLGSDNILIPVSSDVFKAAEANTARLNKSASLKDLKPGYRCIMLNGDEGIYLGSHYTIVGDDRLRVKCEDKKRHFYGTRDEQGKWIALGSVATLKLSEIFEGDEITIEQCEGILNQTITNDVSVSSNGYKTIHGVTNKRLKDEEFEYKFIPYADLAEIKKLGVESYSQRSKHQVVVQEADGSWGTFAEPYSGHHSKPNQGTSHIFNKASYDAGSKLTYLEDTTSRNSYYGYSSGYRQQVSHEVDTTNPSLKWYLVQISYTTTHGFQHKKFF